MVGKINETNDHEISPPSLPNGWSAGDLGEDETKKMKTIRHSFCKMVGKLGKSDKTIHNRKIGQSVGGRREIGQIGCIQIKSLQPMGGFNSGEVNS